MRMGLMAAAPLCEYRGMKRILDSSFRYTPSFATDVRKTFARLKRAQRTRTPVVKVLTLNPVKRSRER
jgi:hypothetical protein